MVHLQLSIFPAQKCKPRIRRYGRAQETPSLAGDGVWIEERAYNAAFRCEQISAR
jgi:hypothetical protein